MKNIPAILLAGMFFFSMHGWAGNLDLATDLFEQGEWELCRRECRRALISEPRSTERFQLLEAMALICSGKNPTHAIQLLSPVIEANVDQEVTAIASYELGRLQWQLNAPEDALNSFEYAFASTTNKTLFLHASCSMFQLLKEHKTLEKGREALISQIQTSRSEWYGPLFSATAKPDPEKNQPQAPNWIVRFYRSQISPAIGSRCVLEPSCSEYFHQAYCKHGLKAAPMIADRFFREPELSNEKKDPVAMPSGQIRYRDPLENHDFWMKKK
ncbi:MAG TPA: membrane protein insertion efficiency factor YidD [Pontiella sp.]